MLGSGVRLINHCLSRNGEETGEHPMDDVVDGLEKDQGKQDGMMSCQNKPAMAAHCPSARSPGEGRLGEAGKLRLIERALNIGNSYMAEWNLQDWGDDLEANAAEDVRLRARGQGQSP
jgi:hypothetical protein